MERYFHDITIAIESIISNKIKSLLTALGIIFGVAAVISMLAIGNGAQQEILEQIKLAGVNNIIVNSLFEEEEENSEENTDNKKKKFSRGLTVADAEAIKDILPTVSRISPEVALNSYITFNGNRKSTKLIGVSPAYFDLYNIELEKGSVFSQYQAEHGQAVCIIGSKVKAKFFSKTNAVGKKIKCGDVWLKVTGVVENRFVSSSTAQKMGVNNLNDKIYIPIKTILLRYKNRALIATTKNNRRSDNKKKNNYHQLDKIIVQVKETADLIPSTEIITRMIYRRHSEVDDFEVAVPELQLKQQQQTKNIFNIVLGAIAGISLVVGGIGIMNIMLASVMERIKEIGTRLAIGATKKDIVVQFISEAMFISITGGLVGIVLGIILSKLITKFTNILTIVSPTSVIIAFGVSVSVGIIFGFLPAKRASEQDPVVSLRN